MSIKIKIERIKTEYDGLENTTYSYVVQTTGQKN
jgi:hypothetical protein